MGALDCCLLHGPLLSYYSINFYAIGTLLPNANLGAYTNSVIINIYYNQNLFISFDLIIQIVFIFVTVILNFSTCTITTVNGFEAFILFYTIP